MRIGLVDVDNRGYPNLPLMKISAYHKSRADVVEWYTPNRAYDKVYMSKVFSFTPEYAGQINAAEVVRGGTGYAISLVDGQEVLDPSKNPPLPIEVEQQYPDYSLYNIADTAYGFLTRGCPRRCTFCHVGAMQGAVSHKVADLDSFWGGQKNIVLLDPNITACREWRPLFEQLINSKAYVDFSQGLDVRLMTTEKTEMLMQMRIKMIHFAWDRYEDINTVLPKLKEFKKQTSWGRHKVSVYVLTNYSTTLEQDIERITAIRDIGFHPYVMRYNREGIPRGSLANMLARWTNMPAIFWKYPTFSDYLANETKGGLTLYEDYFNQR